MTCAAVTETGVTTDRECRVVGHLVGEIEAAEPTVGKMQPLLAVQ